VTCEYPPLLV